MANNRPRQRKSSFSFLFVFNLFKSKKGKGAKCNEAAGCKVWHSDYDKGSWGVAEPGIDKKAGAFIDKQRKSFGINIAIHPAAAGTT
ncbi:hypothetical protein SESBI_35028 [Sesbania bispinosa]|nr:hypothetical protein SESBI_35028 [Sesbania bispinosa]